MANLNGLYNTSRSKSTLKRVDDPELKEQLSQLIEAHQSQLKGEYSPYAIYKEENNEIYALIHAFYLEKDGIPYDNMAETAKKDAKLMHDKIKQLDLKLDYLFILPYYDYQNREKGSVMVGAIVTNEF